jgi:hypothetical protein
LNAHKIPLLNDRGAEISFQSANEKNLLLFARSGIAMLAKTPLILALVASLFFSTQAFPFTSPVEIKKGDCAKMECAMGCCANKTCCAAMQQHRAQQPIHETSRLDLQLAAIGSRDFAPLYFLPPALRSFVIRDDARAGHTPPLLAVNCIRLI